MLPLAVVASKVSPAGLWWVEADASILKNGGAVNLIWMTLVLAQLVSLNIRAGLVDIASNVEGVAGSLRDGETEVKSNTAGHGAETNNDTPHLVNSKLADTIAISDRLGGLE